MFDITKFVPCVVITMVLVALPAFIRTLIITLHISAWIGTHRL